MKYDALESIPCEVFSVDQLQNFGNVKVLTRDNVHTWARENGGPIEITDEMVEAGADVIWDMEQTGAQCSEIARTVYAAMEAKRREGKS